MLNDLHTASHCAADRTNRLSVRKLNGIASGNLLQFFVINSHHEFS
jgi:hypothetical protein